MQFKICSQRGQRTHTVQYALLSIIKKSVGLKVYQIVASEKHENSECLFFMFTVSKIQVGAHGAFFQIVR